jgi:hypothetical protein
MTNPELRIVEEIQKPNDEFILCPAIRYSLVILVSGFVIPRADKN